MKYDVFIEGTQQMLISSFYTPPPRFSPHFLSFLTKHFIEHLLYANHCAWHRWQEEEEDVNPALSDLTAFIRAKGMKSWFSHLQAVGAEKNDIPLLFIHWIPE